MAPAADYPTAHLSLPPAHISYQPHRNVQHTQLVDGEFDAVASYTVHLNFDKDGNECVGTGFFVNWGQRYDSEAWFKFTRQLQKNQVDLYNLDRGIAPQPAGPRGDRAPKDPAATRKKLLKEIQKSSEYCDMIAPDLPKWDVIITAAHNLVNSDGSRTTNMKATITTLPEEVELIDPTKPINKLNMRGITESVPGYRTVPVPQENYRICPDYESYLAAKTPEGDSKFRASDYAVLLIPLTPRTDDSTVMLLPRPGFGFSMITCLEQEPYASVEMAGFNSKNDPGSLPHLVSINTDKRQQNSILRNPKTGVLKYKMNTDHGNSGAPVWVFGGDNKLVVAIHTFVDTQKKGVDKYGHGAPFTVEMVKRIMGWVEAPWQNVSLQGWDLNERRSHDLFLHFRKPSLGTTGHAVVARDLNKRRFSFDVLPGWMPQGEKNGTWAFYFAGAKDWESDFREIDRPDEYTGRIGRADRLQDIRAIATIRQERTRLNWIAWNPLADLIQLRGQLATDCLITINWNMGRKEPSRCFSLVISESVIGCADDWESRYKNGGDQAALSTVTTVYKKLSMSDHFMIPRERGLEINELWDEFYMAPNLRWADESERPQEGETIEFSLRKTRRHHPGKMRLILSH